MDKESGDINAAVKLVKKAKHISVFTGAGISVESGIPPFRGKNGIYEKYDPNMFQIEFFMNNPEKAWNLLFEIFYTNLSKAIPNQAHKILSTLEQKGIIKSIITQNIDNLHKIAGSINVFHFHGTISTLICLECHTKYDVSGNLLDNLPPFCPKCDFILKPDIVFFGEPIPEDSLKGAINEANCADLFIIIGSTGEVRPASDIPHLAKRKNCNIIEINIKESNFTRTITDIFLQGKAGKVLNLLNERLK